MAERPRTILICSCEDTIPLDGEAVHRVCRGAELIEGRQLCRAEIERFRKAAADGEPVLVACTQEAPLFSEVAEESGAEAPTFVNIRETAGWAKDAAKAGPKMAALIAASGAPMPDVPFVPFTSDGVTLLYGRDERVIEAAELLKEHLDVTVLIKAGSELTPRRVTEFPVVRGVIRAGSSTHRPHRAVTMLRWARPRPCRARGAHRSHPGGPSNPRHPRPRPQPAVRAAGLLRPGR